MNRFSILYLTVAIMVVLGVHALTCPTIAPLAPPLDSAILDRLANLETENAQLQEELANLRAAHRQHQIEYGEVGEDAMAARRGVKELEAENARLRWRDYAQNGRHIKPID